MAEPRRLALESPAHRVRVVPLVVPDTIDKPTHLVSPLAPSAGAQSQLGLTCLKRNQDSGAMDLARRQW